MTISHAHATPHAMSRQRIRRRSRAAAAAVALATLLGAVVLATPAAAQEQPANLVRSGPDLTLVVASCASTADLTAALELARHQRNAAVACLGSGGVSAAMIVPGAAHTSAEAATPPAGVLPADLAPLIAEYAPNRVLIVGGEAAVHPAAMDDLAAAARSAYRWAIVQRLGGATRADTAAAAARVALDTPERAGLDTVTLVLANGWNDAEVNTARAFAATLDSAAVAYFSPARGGSLPEATASLIADYRPARIVFAGVADAAGVAAEAMAAAVLQSLDSTVAVERVALATADASPAVDTATLTSSAREAFRAVSAGERPAGDADDGEQRPYLALTKASGVRGVGSTLFTMRSDGSERLLRTVDHSGWEWHPSDGRLAWSDDDKRVMAAGPAEDGELLADEGVWPLWSPDGSRLMVFDTEDVNDDGWTDRAMAFVSNADGTQRRSLGYVDLRTWYYADIDGGMWSPDGRHLAYATGDIDPETMGTVSQARIEPADGSAPAVTLADDAIILRWSPDSTHLLYATPNDCDGDEEDDSWNLHLATADGASTREIGPIEFNAWDVLIINPWSPDSEHFAYRAIDPQDCSTDIYVSAVGGDGGTAAVAEPVHIVADARFLGWSPDSAYVEYGVETDRPVTDYLLPEQSWLAHRDGSSQRYIGELSPSAYGWIFWSEDGAHISYSEIVRDADGNEAGLLARTQRADGTGKVTTLAQLGNALSWSADGRAAYVAMHDDTGDGIPDREALYVHTPGSPDGDVQLVHALPAPTRVVIWSPDDSHLIYASGSIESLIGWFRDRGRGVNVWGISTSEPRWMHRLITDVTWGEWQPEAEAK